MKEVLDKYEIADDVKSALLAELEDELKSRVVAAQNDPEFHDKIRNEVAGKFYAVTEKAIKNTLGIDIDSLDEDLRGDKKIKAALELGVETLKKSKDKTNQELQQQLLDLKASYDNFKEVEHVEALNQVKSKFNNKLIHSKMFEDASDIKVTCADKAKISLIKTYLSENNIKPVWDEEKEDYQFLTDKNLLPTKDGKSLTKKEILTNAFDFAGVLEKSNGTPPNPPSGIQAPKLPNGFEPSESLKKMAAEAGVKLPA